MSERGVFAVDRGIWTHPVFADEPFTEREAWSWMISEAAFKAHRRRVGTATVELVRGQLAHSLRFMADKWQWSEARVRRFLNRLKIDAMLTTATDAGVTVVTICNYDKYQRVSLPTVAASDAQTDAGATQERRKEEDIKYTELSKEDISSADDWPADFREVFWSAYPRKLGKQGALRELERVRRKSVSFEKLIVAVRAYAATADPEFTKHPQTWLSKGCWDDEPDLRKPNVRSNPGNIIPAANNLVDRVRALAGPPSLRGGAGASVVRMLPEGRRERPGDVHDGRNGDPQRLPAGNDPLGNGPEDGAAGKPETQSSHG